MTRLALAALVLLGASSARAQDDDEPSAPPRVVLRGANVHAGARLLAAVHEVGVWVAAPPGAPLSLEVEGEARAAFRALAGAAGLSHRLRDLRSGDTYWIAEEHRLLRAESAAVRGLSGGRRIDLDFEGADVRRIAELLGAVSNVQVRGVPIGALTVRVREARSTRALEMIARLAGSRVARRGRAVSMRLGSLPPWPEPARACEQPPGGSPGALRCAAIEQIRLVGLGPEHALLAAPGWRAAIVTVGEDVGRAAWRVESISADGIELARGEERRTLALGAD